MGVNRRDLLRWSLVGAPSLWAAARAGVVAAAGGRGPGTPPGAGGPPWWLTGNFAPVFDELDVADLEVRGALPPALVGRYVKNGSNPPRSNSPHWFFGDGMVHGVRLAGGRAAWYRNRYVATVLHESGLDFGQGPPGGASNQSNVSAIWHGGRLLTSGEVGLPYELDPETLTTIGPFDFGGALTTSFTAHPKIDPATGLLHSFGYGFTPPYLTYRVSDPAGTIVHQVPIELPASVMMHDFSITETDVVFWDLPVLFDLDAAVRYLADPSPQNTPFQWRPEHGARLGVMPLGGDGTAITWYDLPEPAYVFHGVNAFRREERIVLDVCRLASMFDPAVPEFAGDASLRRWEIDTAGGGVLDTVMVDVDPGDLPTRDPRRVGRPYRYGYLAGARDRPGAVEFGPVVKQDVVRGQREVWDPGPGRHATEPLFVPADPNDLADDAGWLLAFVHDDANDESTLAVLDATAVPAGPVAEVVMPRRVPYGFHATWIPDG